MFFNESSILQGLKRGPAISVKPANESSKEIQHYPDDEHEIPRERVIICHLLGTGAFGIVHKGLLTNGASPPQEVAVKTLRGKSNFLAFYLIR